jgi:hypothetical protein
MTRAISSSSSKPATAFSLMGRQAGRPPVCTLFAIEPEQIFSAGKYPLISRARSLFCYWAVRELGLTATLLAGKFHLSQPAISMAVKRGENLAREGKYSLADKGKL